MAGGKSTVVLLVVIMLTASSLRAGMEPKVEMPIFSPFDGLRGILATTPSICDDPACLWINPALLGTGTVGGITYLHTYNDSTISGDDAIIVTAGPLAFGAELMRTVSTELTSSGSRSRSYSTRRYTIAAGKRLYKGLYAGVSYAWHTSELWEIDKTSTWAAGALFQPGKRVSIGLTARDLNSPRYRGTRFKPIYELAIGLRPFGNQFTLTSIYTWRDEAVGFDGQTQPRSFLTYGAQFELARGLKLATLIDEDGNINASFTVEIGNLAIRPVVRRMTDGKTSNQTTGATLVTVDRFWHESIFMPKSYLEINLDGRILETRRGISLLGDRGGTVLRDLLDRIAYAREASDVQAIVLRCGNIGGSLAVIDELRQAILDFRKSGKKVIAYLENPGSATYYLATSADYIALVPNGYIGLVGFKTESLFLKGTLAKLGIEAKHARVGKYKSAVEPLTRDTYTEPSREALNAVLDDMYEKFIDDIAAAKNWSREHTQAIVDSGPYIPTDAVAIGLVDTLAYWDEIPDILSDLVGRDLRGVSYSDFAKRNLKQSTWGEPATIGIIYGVGGITHGRNRRDLFAGDIMGSETICEAFRQMREDKSVKAVVFRVDSPGGLMTASDKIRHEVELTAREKPVIVSMGGVAASGGYHVSCAATRILADYATVTGSIGVLNLWLHTRGFYQKIGANKEIFIRGKNADFFPTWRKVTDEHLKRIQWYVDRYYERFIKDVARGRHMGVDEVDRIAQGRIWSGKRASEIGLVDEIGGLRRAIDVAKVEAGIPKDEPVRFKILPRRKGFLAALASSLAPGSSEGLVLPDEITDLARTLGYLSIYDEPVLYLMPYTIELQ